MLAVAWACPAVAAGGAGLRARHRWAADVWRVDGTARLVKWRAADTRGPSSRVEGGPGGVRLGGAGDARPTTAELELDDALPAGPWALSFDLTASATPLLTAPGPARLLLRTAAGATLADVAVPPGAPLHVVTAVVHAGGPLHLVATITSDASATVLVSGARLDHEAVPDPAPRGS